MSKEPLVEVNSPEMTTLYIPTLSSAPEPVQPPSVRVRASDEAAVFFVIMRIAPGQRRPSMVWDSRLIAAAEYRAIDLVRRNYFDHVDPDGIGPNDIARRFGYPLPEHYPRGDANSIESIIKYTANAAEAWAAFMGSEGHTAHLLGLHESWAAQTRIGIGVAMLDSGLLAMAVLTAPEVG